MQGPIYISIYLSILSKSTAGGFKLARPSCIYLSTENETSNRGMMVLLYWRKIPGCHHEGPVLLPQCRLLNVVVAADHLAVDDAARQLSASSLRWSATSAACTAAGIGTTSNPTSVNFGTHSGCFLFIASRFNSILLKMYIIVTVIPREEKIYKTYTTHLPSAVKPPFSVQIGILNPKSSTTWSSRPPYSWIMWGSDLFWKWS